MDIEKKVQDLTNLLEITKALTAEKDLDSLLTLIIDKTTAVMNAERSSLFLVDYKTNELWSKIAQQETKEIRVPLGVGIVGFVATTKEIVNIEDAYKDPRFNKEIDKITGYHTRTILCVPLLTHEGKVVGVLQVINKKDGVFSPYDESLLMAFANHAAISIDNAQLIEHYLEKEKMKQCLKIAKDIQEGFLPKEVPQVPGLDIHGWGLSCEETGGDYYDFIPFPDGKLGLVIGDVAGHGIGSALLMATARAFLKVLMIKSEDLSDILYQMNNLLEKDMSDGRFMTMFLCMVNGGKRSFNYSSAGHDSTLIFFKNTGEFERLESTGLPLGILMDQEYPEGKSLSLSPGDILVLLTDGVWEAKNQKGEKFGLERLCSIIKDSRYKKAQQIIDEIYQGIKNFCEESPQKDDITLVIAKIDPK